MYRVVVVEDSELLRRGLVTTTDWLSLGCEVTGQAADGVSGATLILEKQPDIVITDIRMPGLNGLEMMQRVEGRCSSKFIIITAYNEFDYARQALQMGAVDYLSKPIEEGALEKAVGKCVSLLNDAKEYRKFRDNLEHGTDSRIMLFREYLSGSGSVQNDHVEHIVSYITNHYGENIGLKEICDALKLSESHSNRLMKEATGYTVSDYLQNYRIKKACDLLSVRSAKIYEVADEVGIHDQRYFSVVFKKLVGLTPSEFQNRLNTN
jgi:two-component system response regulator YesN